MTTPTREQVVTWMSGCGICAGLAHYIQFATLARADLAATVEEQAKEIESLKSVALFKEVLRGVTEEKLAESQAYAAQLRSKISDCLSDLEGGFIRCERCGDQEDTATMDVVPILRDALAIQPDETALREHDEKLKERIASMVEGMGLVGNEGYHCADKIRKGEF